MLHIATPEFPCRATTPFSQGFRYPYGGRIQRGVTPVADEIASSQRSSSSAICDGVSQVSDGCVSVWFPISCPRSTISRASAGNARTCRPIRKNVALTRYFVSNSSSCGVADGFGPSSNVKAIDPLSPVCQTVRPNSCDDGTVAP